MFQYNTSDGPVKYWFLIPACSAWFLCCVAYVCWWLDLWRDIPRRTRHFFTALGRRLLRRNATTQIQTPPFTALDSPARARPPQRIVACDIGADCARPPRRMETCDICMDMLPSDAMFRIAHCNHSYCRACIRKYITSRLDHDDVTPPCPHDACNTLLAEGDFVQILTGDERRRYFSTSLRLAIRSEPGLFSCLRPGCHGAAALPPSDPHFVCPLCGTGRCVRCNTREWHEGCTCEEHINSRLQYENQLFPEQLLAMYGPESRVYQCGACGFGPIEHSHCSNLVTHNGRRVGAAVVNNACPRCGWFRRDISEWPRWNPAAEGSAM